MQARLDKDLVKGMLLAYFTAPAADRKREVLQLMSRLCHCSEQEEIQVRSCIKRRIRV